MEQESGGCIIVPLANSTQLPENGNTSQPQKHQNITHPSNLCKTTVIHLKTLAETKTQQYLLDFSQKSIFV